MDFMIFLKSWIFFGKIKFVILDNCIECIYIIFRLGICGWGGGGGMKIWGSLFNRFFFGFDECVY